MFINQSKMGLLTRVLLLAMTAGSAVLVYKLIIEPHPVPLVEDEYWGPISGRGTQENSTIHPFVINISSDQIEDLKVRLKRELDSKRLLPPLEDIGFEYGFNLEYLQTVGEYWLKNYDWRAREKLLNKYPHFTTKIAGLSIHFQHIKSKPRNGNRPRPLLLLHSFPGSIVEFQKIIPLLSEPKNSKYNYELIIPCIPGFGWSQAAARRGLSPTEIGNIFKRLMQRLGHDKFYIMGGDWGAIISSDMATVYPENVIAVQSTMCIPMTVIANIRYVLATTLPSIFMPGEAGRNVLPLSDLMSFLIRETGFFIMQATKPDTMGVGLVHSPLALASYILDKFATFTNRKWISRETGGLTEKFTMDELLDNVMVYWVTASMISAQRLDAELMDPAKKFQLDRVPTSVPFSCQFLSEDIYIMPEFALRDKYTNMNHSITLGGGHYGSFEVPSIVAENAILHFDSH